MSFNILGFAIELDLVFYANIAIKIIVACVLGGLIGYERETLNRPAGLRTHILVCVGATIAMIVNLDLVSQYDGIANVNPGRFGASVISGIGFLGAGTIIKEGVSVKGLTTAASLWTVACLGLVIGSGLYFVAIFTTITIYITLHMFFKVESRISPRSNSLALTLVMEDTPGQIGKVGAALGDRNVNIKSIKVSTNFTDTTIQVTIKLKLPKHESPEGIILFLSDIHGVIKVDRVN